MEAGPDRQAAFCQRGRARPTATANSAARVPKMIPRPTPGTAIRPNGAAISSKNLTRSLWMDS